MSRQSRGDQAAERKKSAAEVMRSLTTKCCKCGTPGSKRRLINMDQGPTCSGCLDDTSLIEALREEKVNKTLYEPDPDAKPPENFGEWA